MFGVISHNFCPHWFSRLILVNPASSIKQQPWLQWGSYLTQWLPDWFYPSSIVGLLPFLGALGRIGFRTSSPINSDEVRSPRNFSLAIRIIAPI